MRARHTTALSDNSRYEEVAAGIFFLAKWYMTKEPSGDEDGHE
tara:strand:+ start:81 stop:209 length:129 start_codon:yes stop_codon:yes gene_type:complete